MRQLGTSLALSLILERGKDVTEPRVNPSRVTEYSAFSLLKFILTHRRSIPSRNSVGL